MLGQRDEGYRREIGVSSIAQRVRLHTAREVRLDPEQTAARAAARVGAPASRWWLHVDLDVLDETSSARAEEQRCAPMAAEAGASACTTRTWILTAETPSRSSPISPASQRTAADGRGDRRDSRR